MSDAILKKTNKIFSVKKIAVSAIFGALGFVLMLLEFPLPFIIPAFIKFDFSELPAIIASFAYGPLHGILVCFVKNALHCIVSSTMCVGELSNFILGALFVGTAGTVYSFMHSRKGALIGALCGAFLMAIVSVFTNYYIVYPAFSAILELPMEAILGMYRAILPSADNLWKALLIFNLPFNFAKGVIDAAICFVVYKKMSPILKSEKRRSNKHINP